MSPNQETSNKSEKSSAETLKNLESNPEHILAKASEDKTSKGKVDFKG